jgi:hypothetical protein
MWYSKSYILKTLFNSRDLDVTGFLLERDS